MIIRAFVVEKGVEGKALELIEVEKGSDMGSYAVCLAEFFIQIRKVKDSHNLIKVETDDDFLFNILRDRLKVTDCEVVKIEC